MDHQLTPEELRRYSRHIILPDFGIEGQLKLKKAKVLVIGSGGLGSPVLLYLAAAGIGHIGILDFDRVDDSNLQRQVLFTTADIGMSKALQAKSRILALNPNIEVTVHDVKLDSQNARDIIRQYDIVADGTDNFPTRYLVNDACVLENKVNVYASIYQFEGQVSVFHYQYSDGTFGPNYRDLFPEPPPPGLVPSCAEGGVLGVLPGIIGSMQALEVIKVISGVGDPLSGKLFLFDASTFQTRLLKIHKNPKTQIKALIDYQVFCGLQLDATDPSVESITVEKFVQWQNDKIPHQLVDVREQHEYALGNLKGDWIPLGKIVESSAQLNPDIPVVVHCKSGIRSAKAIALLRENGYPGVLINLEGGILAYSNRIDPSILVT